MATGKVWQGLKESPLIVVAGFVIGAFVAGITAVLFMDARIESRTTQTIHQYFPDLPTAKPGSSIGTVTGYWGTIDELTSAGYELCDGELVTTKESPIRGRRKPDLRDKFMKGAVAGVKDVAAAPELGGLAVLDLQHSHPDGDLFACISVRRISGDGNVAFPHSASGRFKPSNDGLGNGGRAPSVKTSGGIQRG